MNRFIRCRVLAALMVLFAAGCTDDAPAPRKPDLVLIVVDTLRADHLSAYGYPRPTSPRIDRLAAAGALFTDATAQSSWTLPSMASMLSGRHVFVNAHRMPASAPALAERLRDAGYRTAAFVANPAVSRGGGFDRGFDAFITRDDTGNITWNAPDLERAFLAWLAQDAGDAPRFLYLHYLDPHFPYAPPASVTLAGTAQTGIGTDEAWAAAVAAAGPGDPLALNDERDRAHVAAEIDRYDREIAATDASIARVLDALDAAAGTGAPRPRLVVLAADHGEGLWDHRHHPVLVERDAAAEERSLRHVFFRDHSYHLFQELIRTPLIVAGPGFPEGARIDAPVENVDVVPTLLEAAGIAPDPALDGTALQRVAAGEERAASFLYSFANEGTMVREAASGWKFVFPTDTGFSFGMEIQLYDLRADPGERKNVAGENAEVLRKFIRLREQKALAFDLYQDGATEADEEQQRALEQMGYLTAPRPAGKR